VQLSSIIDTSKDGRSLEVYNIDNLASYYTQWANL